MKKNVFVQELGMHLRSVVTWSLSIAALIGVFGSLYSSFADDAALLSEMMAKFPPQFLAAFGMTNIDLSTIPGYFGLLFLFVQICLAIQAANYGFGLASIEEAEWTADFLLAKPVSRAAILTSKLLAALCALAITQAVVWASTFGFVELVRAGQPYEAGPLALVLLSMIPFQLFFLTVGLLISLMVKRVRSVTPYAMGLAFGMYLLSAFGDMLGESALEKLTPFQHFEANYILQQGSWDARLVAISFAVIVLALVGSYVRYARRDIPSAV